MRIRIGKKSIRTNLESRDVLVIAATNRNASVGKDKFNLDLPVTWLERINYQVAGKLRKDELGTLIEMEFFVPGTKLILPATSAILSILFVAGVFLKGVPMLVLLILIPSVLYMLFFLDFLRTSTKKAYRILIQDFEGDLIDLADRNKNDVVLLRKKPLDDSKALE